MTFDLFDAEFDAHAAALAAARGALRAPFEAMLAAWTNCARDGGRLLFFGNGGSAGHAQHFAAELVVRLSHDRAPIPAIALTADIHILTACANDHGYSCVFARQVEALGRRGDLAVGISTSGRSLNVIAGLRAARDAGLACAALTGGDGGSLPGLAHPCLIVPATETVRIQEMHLLLGHMLCAGLESALGLVPR